MRSRQLDLNKYDSDKISNQYLDTYDEIFDKFAGEEVNVLELGINKGGSLLLWKDYFPKGKIVGIDLELPKNWAEQDRVRVFQGNQSDLTFLDQVCNECFKEGIDIIIDDASHIGELTKISFWHLFDNYLNKGGYYVIEDWGTGYYKDWPDGKAHKLKNNSKSQFLRSLSSIIARQPWLKFRMKSHDYGMVGFIKQLVDEQGAADVSRISKFGRAKRKSKFSKTIITPSIVFIQKALSE